MMSTLTCLFVAVVLVIITNAKVPDVCKLPSDAGPCNKTEVKVYYNDSNHQCQQFTYGGCQGNDNRFNTEDECQTTCLTDKEICFLPRQPGLCLGYNEVYFYNSTSGQCKMFIYGGCGGNANRFATKDACNEKCQKFGLPKVCSLPAKYGTCRGNIPKFFFNFTSGKCEQFKYSGCGGNGNNFDNKQDCEGKCQVKTEPRSEYFCLLQPETGPCRAYMPNYYYNVTSRACDRFIYGGCQGNENRFETKSECERECSSNISPPPPERLCQLQPETGLCAAYFTRFFYNITTRACESFTYGGCGRNDNSFETIQSCQDRCQPTTKAPINICNLDPDSGPCKALEQHYFYNSTSETCETFIYGGCRGNGNRFPTEADCLETCSTKTN